MVDTNKLTPTNFRKRIEGTKVELYLRIKSPYNNKAYFAPRDVGPFELEVNFDAPDTIRLTKSFLNAAGIDLSAVILSK